MKVQEVIDRMIPHRDRLRALRTGLQARANQGFMREQAPSVLFDFSRIYSSLLSPAEDAVSRGLFIGDLAKLIEGICLYERVFSTEDFSGWLKGRREKEPQSGFDLSHWVFDQLDGEVFCRVPEPVAEDEEEYWHHEDTNREEYKGHSVFGPDLEMLPAIKARVEKSRFRMLGNDFYTDDDIGIVSSLARTRLLMRIASSGGVPYDPIPFREPIVRHFGSSKSEGERPVFDQFQTEVQHYLSGLVGDVGILQVPLFFAVVLREAASGCPEDLFRVALQIRGERRVEELRQQLSDLYEARQVGDVSRIARAQRIANEQLQILKARLEKRLIWPLNVSISLTHGPVDFSLDLNGFAQRVADGRIKPAWIHLRKITLQTFQPLVRLEDELRRVLGVHVEENDLETLFTGR